jgi:predicted nucleotidyltransferase
VASTELPGTPEHRSVLRVVAAHYADDQRILAVALFGSLARGAWDAHSDLDLAVVVADGVRVDPIDEVGRLCRSLGQEPATVEPDGGDAVDVVLPSLVELSIQYRPLAATTPFAADGVLVLAGGLDARTIEAAGRANRPERPPIRPGMSRPSSDRPSR